MFLEFTMMRSDLFYGILAGVILGMFHRLFEVWGLYNLFNLFDRR